MKYDLTVLIERGEDGAYIASIPALRSCYTQAASLSEAMEKIYEAALLCLEVGQEAPSLNRFVGVQQMELMYEPT
jgi:predicted RNase H-like HicB family nuclease